MFSATKLVGIAAAVALFGALMLTVPFGSQQDTPSPAAPAADPGGITTYSGTYKVLGQNHMGAAERFDWGTSREGEQWTSRTEMSDLRMSGLSTCYSNVYQTGEGGLGWLRTFNCRTFSGEDGGTWREVGQGYMDPKTSGIHYQYQKVGEGVYEGLYAIQRCDMPRYGDTFECEGAIFSGGLPPTPEDPPDEIPPIHGTP